MKKAPPPPNTRGRIVILQAAFVLMVAALAVRLYQLQIVQHDFYARKVLPRGKSLQRSLTGGGASALSASHRRGDIYDRRGRVLAVSTATESVYGVPAQLRREDSDRIRKACAILQVSSSALKRKLDSGQHFIWIKRKVAPKVVARLEELDLEGIGFREENQRYYPARELSAQVLGFTGIDNHGLEGVELFFDKLLSDAGKGNVSLAGALSTGKTFDLAGFFCPAADSSQGIGKGVLNCRLPDQACDIFLTIDKVIQYQTEKELHDACTSAKAKAGMAIVMDVQSAGILAMANWPLFNPNSFSKVPARFRRNRCITDAFEPGSVFKTFLAAAALDTGTIGQNDIIYCENGVFQIGRRTIRDTHKHGWMTLGDIVRVSSNIGSAKIGLSLEREKFYRLVKEFGFGSKTGVLLPGEAQGFIPPLERWTDLTTANISFGQGILTTPLQIITAVCCLANKGWWREPAILKAVAGRKVRSVSPSPLSGDAWGDGNTRPKSCFHGDRIAEVPAREPVRRVVSPSVCEKLSGMLEMVVKEGTGTAAFIPGYRVAGKTGTAQKVDPQTRRYSQELFCSSFVGFFPADCPQIAILVMIDEPMEEHLAGAVAAPAFRKIAQSIIRYLNIPPVQGGPAMAAYEARAAQGSSSRCAMVAQGSRQYAELAQGSSRRAEVTQSSGRRAGAADRNAAAAGDGAPVRLNDRQLKSVGRER
ncbi:MAG: penicillin-binding protein 2 [bacterium]